MSTEHVRLATVILTMGLLALLVWTLNPRQARLVPAPLEPLTVGCQKLPRLFVPTNITEIPQWRPELRSASALDAENASAFQALSPDEKTAALLRLNMTCCTCGCKMSVAGCRVNEPTCRISAGEARAMLKGRRK